MKRKLPRALSQPARKGWGWGLSGLFFLLVVWSIVPIGETTLIALIHGADDKGGTATAVIVVSVCAALVGTLAAFLLVVKPEDITECSKG